jgi:hypothetical protein
MQEPFDVWMRLLTQWGWKSRRRLPPPLGRYKPRSLRLEQLASRQMLAGDLLSLAPSLWQNPVDPLDANGDGQVTARDALVVANALANLGSGSLAMLQAKGPVFYVDVNGDGQLTSDDFDALVWHLDARHPAAQPAEKEDAAKLPPGSDTS